MESMIGTWSGYQRERPGCGTGAEVSSAMTGIHPDTQDLAGHSLVRVVWHHDMEAQCSSDR